MYAYAPERTDRKTGVGADHVSTLRGEMLERRSRGLCGSATGSRSDVHILCAERNLRGGETMTATETKILIRVASTLSWRTQ